MAETEKKDFWEEINWIMMHHPMKPMNAMESLMDMKMLQLDLIAGLVAEMLVKLLFPKYTFNPLNISLIIASRAIVDSLYYYLVSKTNAFGGSMLEFVLSIPVFSLLFKMFNPRAGVVGGFGHGLIFIAVLFAVARVTGWG